MKFYSVVAKSYNELYKEEQIRKLNLIKNEVEVIPPLLDIGCGTGISTNFLTKDSIGIDNNKEMLLRTVFTLMLKACRLKMVHLTPLSP